MGLLGFLRVGVWMNGLRAFRSGFMGNVLGEGFVLGGVFVIGREQQVKAVHLCSFRSFKTLQNNLFLPPAREYFWSTERENLEIKSTLKTSPKPSTE